MIGSRFLTIPLRPQAIYRGDIDERLPPNEKVVAVMIGDVYKAYPYSITFEEHVIMDDVGDIQIVVFHGEGAVSALDDQIISDSKEVGSTGVFNRVIDGETLTFNYDDGYFYDYETGSKWDITGYAIDGAYHGKRLERIKHGDYFAFAWFAFRPETEIYTR